MGSAESLADVESFVTELVVKNDEFSQTSRGFLATAPGKRLARRDIRTAPLWALPLAWYLLGRERRALRASSGIAGVPALVATDRHSLTRTWTDGQPLSLVRATDPAFYRDAARLLARLRRAGVTHNDLSKPQNWIVAPDGSAAVIDFQLARRHLWRGPLFRIQAYEDRRHLAKQKRTFAPELMGPRERRMAETRSAPGRLWRATGKRLYNFVTRRLLDWSDGEGLGGRAERDGPATEAALLAQAGVRAVALVAFARPGRRAGLCAFCEADPGTDGGALLSAQAAAGGSADVVTLVEALPRTPAGQIDWTDLQARAAAHAPAP